MGYSQPPNDSMGLPAGTYTPPTYTPPVASPPPAVSPWNYPVMPAPPPPVAAQPAAPPAPPPVPTLPATIRLMLHGVTIAMGKIDGTTWDGPGRIAPGQAERLALALGSSNPHAIVLGILGDPVNQALAKPEVIGKAFCHSSAGSSPIVSLRAQRDTFTPQFDGPPTWMSVPLNEQARLHVDLTDDDIAFPDPIGSFQINARDMLLALREQKVVHVRVDSQTNRQVLFAAISVMPD